MSDQIEGPSDPIPDPLHVGDELGLLGKKYRVLTILKEDAYALTVLLTGNDGKVVFKRSRFLWYFGYRPPRFLERFLARKEIANYLRVDGIEGVPRFLGKIGKDSHLHEWAEGTTLNLFDGRVNDSFFVKLRRILEEVHRRGLAYVDFAKDENIVVGEDGDPYLIDFQICFDFGEKRGLVAPLYRWIGRRLVREDRVHLLKHIRRYRPDLLTVEEEKEIRPSVTWRIWRVVVKKPYNIITRRIPVMIFGARRAGRRRG